MCVGEIKLLLRAGKTVHDRRARCQPLITEGGFDIGVHIIPITGLQLPQECRPILFTRRCIALGTIVTAYCTLLDTFIGIETTKAAARFEAHLSQMDLGHLITKTIEIDRSEEHTSELQSRENLVCRLLL